MSRRLLAINALLVVISLVSVGVIVKHLATSHTVSAPRSRLAAGATALGPTTEEPRPPAPGPLPLPGSLPPRTFVPPPTPAPTQAAPGMQPQLNPALPNLPFGRPSPSLGRRLPPQPAAEPAPPPQQ